MFNPGSVPRNPLKGHPDQLQLRAIAEPSAYVQIQKAVFSLRFPQLSGKRMLLFLGDIHPHRGCDLLVEAFAACVDHVPSDVHIAVAGPDEDGWTPRLKQLAARLAIAERVQWLGVLRGDLKWGALRSADALILPSHQGNFAMAVAEAMACSRPVLISNKVNFWREVMISGAGLVEPDTREGTMALMMGFYAFSPEARVHLGIAARRGFERYFESEAADRDLTSVFH